MLASAQDVREFRRAVEKGTPEPLVPRPELDELFERLTRAEACLEDLTRGHLVLALFGGTGVGKSTLLNAIAGAAISEPGERRPTTDRAVCYRHEDDPLPEWLNPGDLSTPPPQPHRVSRLRGVVLLDLPDIDSRAAEHRGAVHRILPWLDLLVVVTSVGKYGDRALYEELAALPQAPRNLIFVLNATDRLQPGEAPRVRSDYEHKLAEIAAISDPEVYSLSARRVLDSPGDGGDEDFSRFVRRLEALALSPERLAALRANAESSLDRLRVGWTRAVSAEEIEEWLRALREVPARLPPPDSAAVLALEEHLAAVASSWAVDRALRASWFPLGFLHYLARHLRPKKAKRGRQEPLADGRDPCAAFTERVLTRPLHLARHAARSAVHARRDKLCLSLPDPKVEDPGSPAPEVARWWDGFASRSRRWGWRFRQHIPPALALFAWAGSIVAGVAIEHAKGSSLLGAVAEQALRALSALSPLALGLGGLGLLLCYLLVYPYFLYRLERKLHREAAEGARVYWDAWEKSFAERWGDPFRERVEAAQAWWEDVRVRFSAIAPRRAVPDQADEPRPRKQESRPSGSGFPLSRE